MCVLRFYMGVNRVGSFSLASFEPSIRRSIMEISDQQQWEKKADRKFQIATEDFKFPNQGIEKNIDT